MSTLWPDVIQISVCRTNTPLSSIIHFVRSCILVKCKFLAGNFSANSVFIEMPKRSAANAEEGGRKRSRREGMQGIMLVNSSIQLTRCLADDAQHQLNSLAVGFVKSQHQNDAPDISTASSFPDEEPWTITTSSWGEEKSRVKMEAPLIYAIGCLPDQEALQILKSRCNKKMPERQLRTTGSKWTCMATTSSILVQY